MKKLFRLSIAVKLIFATLGLLIPTAYFLVSRSLDYFEVTTVQKEYDFNESQAISRATEAENILQGLLEKSRSVGTLYEMSRRSTNEDIVNSIHTTLENDRDIVAVDIYKSEEGKFVLEKSLLKSKAVDEAMLNRLRIKNPFPIESVAQGQIEIVPIIEKQTAEQVEAAAASNKETTTWMAIGQPISKDDLGQIQSITVTYFDLARLQRAFSKKGDRVVFLVDARGNVLAHPDEDNVFNAVTLRDHKLVDAALDSTESRKRMNFNDPKLGPMFGIYVRTAMGPIVVAEVSERFITYPARKAKHTLVKLTGFALSVSIFLVFLLSMALSSPIEKLAGFIRQVSAGNLDVTAKDQIRTEDEVGELATVFDEMVGGLRERAKAYSVMRQALGASVIDTLMTMKDEDMGGKKQPVAVLFSDLRDFTKFSEGHTPEEVVVMLNEYFDVMVKIIAKHGGWLDKFIGDAIMAVWGVPYTGDEDAVRATRAALEMRVELDLLNQRRMERGHTPIKIGVGLHCGDAIIGKIGATERANLTVIGDTVNQASRIESSTKAFGTDILLSQETVDLVEKHFVIEYGGAAEVKGKADALKLYKLRGYKDQDGQVHLIKTQWSDYQAESADKVKVAS
jgi:adenylate cyclase